jgi:DNA-binding PadR family transcriptional regulator
MHGYEVIKEISEMFGGMYAPSAGMVYPTLQWLEDESLVNSSQEEGGKKVYRVNDAGKKFLANGQQTLKRLLAFQKRMPEEKLEMMRAGRKLFRTAMASFPEISERKAKEAVKILNEAQTRLSELIE